MSVSSGAAHGRRPPVTRPRTGRTPPRAVAAAGVVLVVLTFLVICPLLVADPDRADFAGLLAGPSAGHPLGTDQLGRDLLARLVHGGRLTIGLSLFAVLVTGAAGVSVGMAAAATGAFGRVVMRFVDVLAAIPVVLFGLVAAVALGPGAASLLVAVTAIAWTPFARQAYLLTLAERDREYVTAAVSLGAGPVRVLAGHVGRNVLPPLAAHACVRFASTLLTVSGLSFLGLGVQPPTAEWGAMVAEGREYLFTAPHVVLVPSVAVVLTAGTALWCGRRWERAGAR
ncbi:peptide/nickel transport system permease protein [Pseudonocardia ammonioxydans]|uniref:Peptide/nickel transport system permease protein n=1 Tax=Pseudonocardia ammonioxydans TaxID=260086 RepID=A0A1I4S9Y9_PSUAM|nr:ABC transporter permease [Pseudonocardia ammonioxydans]SFM61094.1 peptide/nickel transport system permease protein [Pseudonocardia ammonioxydans]